MGTGAEIKFYPIFNGPEDMHVCEDVLVRCILAKGDRRNCASDKCRQRLDKMGYKLVGRVWACKSCGIPLGSTNHSLSCAIGGPGRA